MCVGGVCVHMMCMIYAVMDYIHTRDGMVGGVNVHVHLYGCIVFSFFLCVLLLLCAFFFRVVRVLIPAMLE